ncbi:MAG: helix-turn-helix transcriptional regulator [Firmicutes bacterium]|nr:helix-turn-helix transcriptional regulator [Bacillota bacterium]
MPIDPVSFGFFIKKLRREKNIPLTKLAALADLSPSYLSRIERGERNIPHARILQRLAPHLGLTPEELLTAAGYLSRKPGSKDNSPAANNYDDISADSHWQEIVRDPDLNSAVREIGRLSPDEKEGLLVFLKAIKLQRELRGKDRPRDVNE